MKLDLICKSELYSVEGNNVRKNRRINLIERNRNKFYSYINSKEFHVLFLFLSFLIVSNFFNVRFIPLELIKILHWLFDIALILYFLDTIFQKKIRYTYIKSLWFIIYFIIVVTLSILMSKIIYNQSFNESIRISLIWYEYLFIFILFKMRITSEEVYKSVMIFSYVWMFCWIVGFCSPVVLFDASGTYDEQMLNYGRGVVRLKIAGSMIMQLWGLWSLSIYVKQNRKKYLCNYLLCMLFTFLLVSRQHIIFYFLCSLSYWLYYSSWIKRSIILLFVVFLTHFVLPNILIYNNLMELTERQVEDNKGELQNDIRMEAAAFYISEFNKSFSTIILGNGAYHYDSDYGKQMTYIGETKGYWLSDVGYVGIYVYFGLAGCFFFVFLGWFIFRIKIPKKHIGLKIFMCFVFLSNVLSHSFDTSVLITGVVLYLMCRENFLYTKMTRLYKRKLYLES